MRRSSDVYEKLQFVEGEIKRILEDILQNGEEAIFKFSDGQENKLDLTNKWYIHKLISEKNILKWVLCKN